MTQPPRPNRIAVVGGGRMGSALVSGLLSARIRRPRDLVVVEPDPARRRALAREFGVFVTADSGPVAPSAGVIVLCVKPGQMTEACRSLAETLSHNPLILSVAAGVTTAKIEKALGPRPVIRVMPNTPALVRAGAMVYSPGRHARPAHEKMARRILSALGTVWKVPEKHMDGVTALSGSGPAYVFYFTECLAEAGIGAGLPPAMARALARHTVIGAGRLLEQSALTPADLRRQVTSPGGTTEAALKVLTGGDWCAVLCRALSAARSRSAELAGLLNLGAPRAPHVVTKRRLKP